jgi:hypothetical protein
MNQTKKPKIQSLNINSAYYNFKLLSELDYVIGEYGKATQHFIFNFNNFVESFVLNEHFLLTHQEWNHHFLIAKATYSNGRPITNLVLTHKNGLQIVDWPYYIERGKVLYVENRDINYKFESNEKSKLYVDFQKKNKDYLKSKYFVPSSFEGFEPEYSFLGSDLIVNEKTVMKQFMIFETTTTPKNLIENLNNTLPNSNFQSTLPLNGFKTQLDINKGLGISKSTIDILKDLHNVKVNELTNYSGYKKIPIPPLVPILLSQCKTIQDIPTKLIELRNDFQDLRNSFLNFEKRIAKSETLKEQFIIIEEYNTFWKIFSKKYKIKTNRLMFHFWDFASSSNASGAIENAFDAGKTDELLDDLSLTKVAGKVIKKGRSYFRDKKTLNRFKGITDLWDLFQNSKTLENQIKDYERIFKIKVDFKELNRIANSIKQ